MSEIVYRIEDCIEMGEDKYGDVWYLHKSGIWVKDSWLEVVR